MSSTTRRSSAGQALAIFAISLTAVLLAGAMAFDGGIVLVERRDQQNAADAAALAGARYLTNSQAAARAAARAAAAELATLNGFTNAVDSASVQIYIPPITGPHTGQNGFIEVQIGSTRPSVFAGLAGIANWDIGARAVALNGDGSGGDFAILALDPEPCPDGFRAIDVTGTGSVEAHGDIQVNSTCDDGALYVGGSGGLEVIDIDTVGYACNVVGLGPDSIHDGNNATVACTQNMGAVPIADPLVDLVAPGRPDLALPPQQVAGDAADIPRYCPGGSQPASWSSPNTCTFNQANDYGNTTWELYPGLYPGGLDLSTGTFHLRPGIYYLAGGGLNAGGNGATALSVDVNGGLGSGGSAAGGVMFYNTEIPNENKGRWDAIHLNGGYADFELLPLDAPLKPESNYNGLIIFNDRNFPAQDDAIAVYLNGGGSNFVARGTVYSPRGSVEVRGNSSEYEFIMDQAIAFNFQLNGGGGSLTALNDDDFIYKLRAAGLVE